MIGLRHGTRRIALMSGVLALLFQLFAWTLTMPATSAPGTDAAICSAQGLVHSNADDALAGAALPTDHPTGHQDGGSCPLCPLIGGLHLPPPLHQMAPGVVVRHGPVALPGALILAGWFLSTLQARAPPV